MYGCTLAHNTTQDAWWSSTQNLYATPLRCPETHSILEFKASAQPCPPWILLFYRIARTMRVWILGASKLEQSLWGLQAWTIALGLWAVFVHEKSCSWSIFADLGCRGPQNTRPAVSPSCKRRCTRSWVISLPSHHFLALSMTTRVRCVSMRFGLIPLRALETTHLRVRKVSSTLSLTGHLFTGHPSSWSIHVRDRTPTCAVRTL